MMKYRLGALVAAGVLAGGFAQQHERLCCGPRRQLLRDLEERIAELEATTARKGNRKVSLTVSGWVGQQACSDQSASAYISSSFHLLRLHHF